MLIRREMAAGQPASRKALLESSNLPIAPFKFLRAKRVEELEDLYIHVFLICFCISWGFPPFQTELEDFRVGLEDFSVSYIFVYFCSLIGLED